MSEVQKTKEKKDDFLAQGMLLAVAMMITKIIGVLYKIPLVNILGDEGMGFHGYAFEVYAFILIISTFSMPTAVSKLVSARVAVNKKKDAVRVFKFALAFSAAIGLFFSLLLFLGANVISKNMMESPLNAYALKVLAPAVFLVSILGAIRGYFQGLGTMMPTAVSQIIEQVVNAVISIVGASIFIKIGMKIAKEKGDELIGPAYGAAGGTLGASMGALFALLFLLLVLLAYRKQMTRQMRMDHSTGKESYSQICKILILTILPVIFSTAIYNINQILDLTLFNKIMAAQGFAQKEYIGLQGIYTGKYNTLINVPLAMANGLAASVLPSLTAAVAIRRRDQIYSKIDQTLRFTTLIAIPCFVGMVALASPLMIFLYNDSSRTPSKMLILGSVTVVTYCLATISNSILQGLDKMATPAKNAGIALGVHLVALLLFMVVFRLSIYSIVLSNIVFSVCMAWLNIRAIRHTCGYRMEFERTLIRPMIAAVIMGVAAYVVHMALDLTIGGRFIPTILAILIAVAVYGACILKLGVLEADDLLDIPKGQTIYKLAVKLHLMA